jgi:cell division protein FtsB
MRKKAGRGAKSAEATIRKRRLRLLWLVGLATISVYLYYRPLASYFETRSDLAESRAEVEALRTTKERLEQRLAFSTSLEATRREARRIGYVRPGEQLFVVKGIPDWRRTHLRTLREDG